MSVISVLCGRRIAGVVVCIVVDSGGISIDCIGIVSVVVMSVDGVVHGGGVVGAGGCVVTDDGMWSGGVGGVGGVVPLRQLLVLCRWR